jgi:opacity protein-like surface antigen
MRKGIILLVMAFLLSASALAAGNQERFQLGISFEPFFPQGEFRDILDRTGWGGSLDAFYRIPNSDLMVGTSLAYYVYGRETRWEPFNVYIPDVLVKVSTINAVARAHLLLRLQPTLQSVKPYVEGLVGLQHLTTDTRVYDDYDFDDDRIASTNHLRSTVLSYGLGGGLAMDLAHFLGPDKKTHSSIILDIGIRYIRGGTADYLMPGDIEIIGDTVNYIISRSRTDMLTPRIGVSFSF